MGSIETTYVPVMVKDLNNVVAINASGANHTCAKIEDGSIYCWGDNYYGQLGDGSLVDSYVPKKVIFPN